MSATEFPRQLSIFDRTEPKASIGGCGDCVCMDCMKWWQNTCPHGGCYDDHRAMAMPFDAIHPGIIRKLWSDWAKTGEQAHWCRGGTFYPEKMCEHYIRYEIPLTRECLNAPVRVWKDGKIDCALVDVVGCEECMRQWEARVHDDQNNYAEPEDEQENRTRLRF